MKLGTVRALRDLASRLRKAGCPVDESGDDWLEMRIYRRWRSGDSPIAALQNAIQIIEAVLAERGRDAA